MRKAVLMVFVIAAIAMTLDAQRLPPPDHTKANINGMQGVMFASAIENERGEFDPVKLPGCRAYLAPGNALHEHLSFPCNEWFVTPAEGSYLVWLATEDAVSLSQSVLMAREVPYRGFGSVAIHEMQAAGFVTIDVPVPADHTLRFAHLDAPGLGFALNVASRDAGKRFPMPLGRVVAGIFDSRGDAVAHHPPLRVKAGETTNFHITPPERGSDLVIVLNKPQGHRDGPPLEVVLQGEAPRAPDVLLDKRGYVVGIWYGLTDERATVSATSPNLELKREVELRPRRVTTLRADVSVKGVNQK